MNLGVIKTVSVNESKIFHMVLCNRKRPLSHWKRMVYQKNSNVFLFTFPIPFFPIEDSFAGALPYGWSSFLNISSPPRRSRVLFCTLYEENVTAMGTSHTCERITEVAWFQVPQRQVYLQETFNCSRSTTESSNLGYGNIL